MTHWFRIADGASGSASVHWFETGDDLIPVRQASFDEPHGTAPVVASVAASREELTWTESKFGELGAGLYTARYGALVDRPVRSPVRGGVRGPVRGGEAVGEAGFEAAWQRARHGRNSSSPHEGGPLPHGTRLTGTVSELPWGPGRTGLFVDLGLPITGFVDMGHLLFDPDDWPPVGTVTEFEVTTVRFSLEPPRGAPQIRLRPTAVPPPGRPWRHPARP
ncbi:hypothetical protein ACIBKX_11005 [Streptomyces sp. NPDC050658]|uniref:hypothetical protein n=1 Tax=unclassified Streptomyces TaxID=2593676 RepID=UPI0034309563